MEEKKNNKKLIMGIAAGVVGILVIIGVIYGAIVLSAGGKAKLAAKTEKFVNEQLLAGQGTATIKIVGEESGLYKLEVNYQGRKIDSYITKDGKKFFPQVFETSPSTSTAAAASDSADQASATEVPKTDKPVVELFTMSYCPYGTQIQKGIIPAIEALGNKVDFKYNFVSYTMHGDKENQENLRQYCINKDQGGKFFSYLTCFLNGSDAPGCLKSTGIDEGKVTSCMAATSKQYDVTGTNFEVSKADNDKYGVQGSPTLVINGVTASSARDSASLLKTICSAFNSAPAECQKTLSSAAPAAGFGAGTDTSGDSAAAGCATN